MSKRKKITDLKSLKRAILDAGLEIGPMTGGSHLPVLYEGREILQISRASNQDPRTYLNYVRNIKQRSGIDIREEK